MTLLAINNIPLIKRFAVRQNYVNSCGAARDSCSSNSYRYGYYLLYICICAKAKLDLWLLLCMYTCMRYCTAKLESQRTAGSKTPTPGEGAAAAGRTIINYHCCAAVGPTRHQGHRRTRGGIRRDTIGTGRPSDTTRTGGRGAQRGDRGRHQEDRREHNGGIGAGRKAQSHKNPTGIL
jgi:hypothetical protein